MAWELTGNTIGPNDFLGTTNDQPLVIKTNNTEQMHVGTNGNVGVGTTSPATKLHVLGPGGGAVVVTIEQPAGMNFVDLKSSQGGGNYGSSLRFIDSGRINASINSTADGQLRFATNGAERLFIGSSGNIGIGTTNPTGPLHILGPTLEPPAGLPAQQNGLLLGLQSTAGYKCIQSYGGPLALNPKGNNVGIGTTQPGGMLHIVSNQVGVLAESSGNFAAGEFLKTTDNNAATLVAINNGNGSALEATSGGTGWAARFVAADALGKGVYISAPSGQPALMVSVGTKSAVVATSQGACALYTEESTEVWFTDYGFGHLQNGHTVIRIDPLFAEAVNLDEPYHVFVQAYGNATLYVSQRTSSTFEVDLREGDSNVEFSYRLVAKRQEHERTRLERVPSADDDPNLYPEKRPEWKAQQRVQRPT